jgi:uncharacterized protein (DUF488 family)
MPRTIYTIGHSTREIDEFLAMLKAHGIEAIADVRSIPKSRRVPQFNDDALAKSLPAAGIEYIPFKQLGGRRHARKDSLNLAWRNESFRGYADFMQTEAFTRGLEELMKIASEKRVATMCAEAVPWRCHRSLIGDALVIRGWKVLDIMSQTKASEHKLTDFAHVDGTHITYPAENAPLFD